MTERELNTERLREVRQARERLETELGKVIIGQRRVVEEILIAMFSRGHVLLVGVPGLAKTLMFRTLARILDLSFRRIQFTPDLMPSDITGTDIIEEDQNTRQRRFQFIEGPLFANLVLADEINRTPPKTQSALLEAMQEHRVTVGGHTYDLPAPFFVLATQNPIEHEGTYPLPEAQLDRFMFQIQIDYPQRDEELDVIRHTTSNYEPVLEPVLGAEEILAIQRLVRAMPVADPIASFAVDLVRETRPAQSRFDFVRRYVNWGAGPRAGQYLLLAAKTRAMLQGRPAVSREDVAVSALPVLRHRVLTNFQAEADGITPDRLIDDLLDALNE